ncbi:hypothetical protein PLICRDRAFT_123227 [Plicaturopsis crispa FD-325 SS-3]|nr:hypothetical protein PLICRDRAFT_123227 [Plicaturopsis crispa FD-325 SS-3]
MSDTAPVGTLDSKPHVAPVNEKADPDNVAAMVEYAAEIPIGQNPLAELSHDEILAKAEAFVETYGLQEYRESIVKGAFVAANPSAFLTIKELNEEDKEHLRREVTHKFASQPRTLWLLVIMCSVAAMVNGMDATVINGANLFYPAQFGIANDAILIGVVNSVPSIASFTVGCWLADPLCYYTGRRGAIFITSAITWVTCFWQGATNSWQHLLVARFFMGVGIGPKSAIVPVYSAECVPALIRGGLVMAWQIFTAFGIMMGFVMSLAFRNLKDTEHVKGLNWRIMLGSAGVPALFVMLQVYWCPESPRWLMSKGRYLQAYKSLTRIRASPLQAGRDLFYIHILLQQEAELTAGGNRFIELFTVPRVRRATLASAVAMLSQQLCGVNVMSFYSSTIFSDAGFSTQSALLASFGFGLLNFVFAFPAVFTIDRWGRRTLLLTTFPLLCIMLLVVAFAFFIPEGSTARIAVIALGIYIYTIFYSVGEGPVPFTYSAEIFPLRHRVLGMAWATAVLWFGSSVLSLTFPYLLQRFTPTGAFGYYACWCFVFFWLILLFVPESAKLTLEELDVVFSVSTRKHAAYQLRQIGWFVTRYILRQDVPKEKLYSFE